MTVIGNILIVFNSELSLYCTLINFYKIFINMDCQEAKVRKTHPRQNANWLSIVFYTYVFDILRTGARRDLNTNDLYKILENFESKKLCKRLEKEWKKELKKKNPSILRAFFQMFGVEFALWGLGIFLISMVAHNVVQPILTGKLMAYFEPGNSLTKSQAIAYIVGIVVSTISFVLYDNTYLFSILAIGIKLRVACSSLIYKKCLKLDLCSNPEYKSGKAVTLITKDVSQFGNAADFGQMLLFALPCALIVICVMYNAIGNATLVGAGCLLTLIPLNIIFGKLTASFRLKTAGKTDQRVKITQEILTSMRIIKMYTWEKFFSACVNKLRLKEINNLKKIFYVKSFAYCTGEMGARFAFYICVITYIYSGNLITAGKAVVLVSSFGTLQMLFQMVIPIGIAQMAELQASLQRITHFLMLEEIPRRQDDDCQTKDMGKILVKDVTLKTINGNVILDKVSLDIGNGLTLVTGSTGSGKSTLLKLFLGDIIKGDGKVDVYGTTSYASQEPWIFPATIRQNILFGQEYNSNRYKEVIEVCALKKDIDSFSNGDSTLVTDKGLNLSKGQKARINLARAVYKKADIYLIDDCFSSVDSGVGSHIFSKCIKRFLKDHTCILVTHNYNLVKFTDHLLIIDHGAVRYDAKKKNQSGLTTQAMIEESGSFNCNEIEKNLINNEESEYSSLIEKPTSTASNMYEETKQAGVIDKQVYYTYLMSAGGWKMILLVILCAIAAQATASWTDYFVSFWVDIEQELSEFKLNGTTNSTNYEKLEESHSNIIKLYSIVILVTTVCAFIRTFVHFLFTSKASTNIHNLVLDKLLNTGIVFFDTHLSGNVLNRFSRDLGIIDEQLPAFLFEFIRMFLSLIAVFAVVSSVNFYFIIPSFVFMVILYFGRQYYIKTGRNLRRLEGAARSPIIGHLNATMEGLPTIRANGAQKILEAEFDKHQDHYTSVCYMNLSTTFGFTLYLDLISTCYAAIVTITFLFLKTDAQAGQIGLAITQSQSITYILQWGVRVWSELENHMTSTERILEYKDVKTESKSGITIDGWPKKGLVIYKNVSLRYAPQTENVLKDINFNIEPRQKIGVVGRTGAGKTSIISTLFCMYKFEGMITIDGVDITTLSINHLRSKISIIPQDPVLFSGTVRSNLDPYSEYSDTILWNALNEVEMKNSIGSLDDLIYEGGFNFSAGEKQLFCLARAILRNNNILILDEATANIDAQTDSIVQKIIRRKFCDCSVITIAHKLHTVLDSDKVLVMDSGKVIQFGPPSELLQDQSGLFYTMVEAVGTKVEIT